MTEFDRPADPTVEHSIGSGTNDWPLVVSYRQYRCVIRSHNLFTSEYELHPFYRQMNPHPLRGLDETRFWACSTECSLCGGRSSEQINFFQSISKVSHPQKVTIVQVPESKLKLHVDNSKIFLKSTFQRSSSSVHSVVKLTKATITELENWHHLFIDSQLGR